MNSTGPAAKADIDRLTESFFALFSNRGGVRPELGRIFDLFVPQGIIARCAGSAPEISSLEAFIEPRQELLSSGGLTDFAEVETSESTHIFGNMAQRLSTYQKSGSRDGVPFLSRGVKSFQYVQTADGWRILSMVWDNEEDGLSLQEST
jgi:ribosomal-protein-serine acetyltransferase